VPATKTSFSAMLHVRDGLSAIDFYQRAFGADIIWTAPGEDTVAQLSVDGAQFWIHEESELYPNPSPLMLGGTTVRLMLIVADPDALFARAIAAGATVIGPIQDHDYGWRDGRLADPFGHHWEIGRPLA
jgi:PhnB protein